MHTAGGEVQAGGDEAEELKWSEAAKSSDEEEEEALVDHDEQRKDSQHRERKGGAKQAPDDCGCQSRYFVVYAQQTDYCVRLDI